MRKSRGIGRVGTLLGGVAIAAVRLIRFAGIPIREKVEVKPERGHAVGGAVAERLPVRGDQNLRLARQQYVAWLEPPRCTRELAQLRFWSRQTEEHRRT